MATKLLDFDQYLKRPIFIPLFVWDDGDVRAFQGFCRGNGPVGGEEKWQRSIGVYTGDGKYFAVVIDTRVHCAIPQFEIDGEPFRYPIVEFATMSARVDPDTGNLKCPPVPPPQSATEGRQP
jgi:hypothetical protein